MKEIRQRKKKQRKLSSDNDPLCKTCHQAIRSLVLSRLDYCNGLLSSVSKSHILRLQRLQNWAVRIIFTVDRQHESSPLLKSLYWLPVKQRITYKLLLYVYKALNDLAPIYIFNCLELYVPKRNLRSSSDCLCLDYPITKNKAGDRNFTVYASKLWNNLPMTLRNCTSVNAFKKALKTCLFPN